MKHIEIILSFLIFVTAVGFALYFFSPGEGTRLIDSSLTYSFREISQNTSVIVESFSVVLDYGVVPQETGTIGIRVGSENSERKSRVERDDVELSSQRSGENVFVQLEDAAARPGGKEILLVELSEDFDEESVGGAEVDESFYDISSSGEEKIISERRIQMLRQSYSADYQGLKEDFNLPNRVNFGFELVLPDGQRIEADREESGGFEIFAETKRVEILLENGDRAFGDLRVRLW